MGKEKRFVRVCVFVCACCALRGIEDSGGGLAVVREAAAVLTLPAVQRESEGNGNRNLMVLPFSSQ